MRPSHKLLALLVLWVGTAEAQTTDPMARGKTIAIQRCAICHAVDREGASPQRIAPPFRTLDERFPIEMLMATLRTGIVRGHDEMPMFELGIADARALVAHIDSLSARGLRYLRP